MKVLYTASVLSHICQFHLLTMQRLQEAGYEVHVAARNNLSEKNGLTLKFTDHYFDIDFQRSPKDKRNISAYKHLKQLVEKERYDIIVCNTPVVGILTRLAAAGTRNKGTKVVYIAHGFHFYTGAPKKYWLIYPIEKLFAEKYTDILITINKEDYRRASKQFKCRVEHIWGVGVSDERYKPISETECIEARRRINITKDNFSIICSKELMFDNNQKTLLRAVARIRGEIPKIKVFIAGNGPDESMLKEMVTELQLDDIVTFLGYRTDLEKIVPAMDMVVSCSYREGMPLNIIEAMLSARPIAASRNRGHNELVDDNTTGYLFDMLDDETLSKHILDVYKNPKRAKEMGEAAYQKAKRYTSKSVTRQIMTILNSGIGG